MGKFDLLIKNFKIQEEINLENEKKRIEKDNILNSFKEIVFNEETIGFMVDKKINIEIDFFKFIFQDITQNVTEIICYLKRYHEFILSEDGKHLQSKNPSYNETPDEKLLRVLPKYIEVLKDFKELLFKNDFEISFIDNEFFVLKKIETLELADFNDFDLFTICFRDKSRRLNDCGLRGTIGKTSVFKKYFNTVFQQYIDNVTPIETFNENISYCLKSFNEYHENDIEMIFSYNEFSKDVFQLYPITYLEEMKSWVKGKIGLIKINSTQVDNTRTGEYFRKDEINIHEIKIIFDNTKKKKKKVYANKKNYLKMLEKLSNIDEYDVLEKYTEIPKDFQVKDNFISVIWKCRHEEENSNLYDLTKDDDVLTLINKLNYCIDDLID